MPATSAALVIALPPPPLLGLPLPGAVVVVPEDEMVTLLELVAVPPGVPVADNENAHVVAEDGAVTDQLTELVPEPATVPTVFVSEATVHWLLVSVAVTEDVEPAASVPEFAMVADTVNAELVETEDGAVSDVMLNSAGEVTVIVPQSAVHVEPR